MLTFVKGCSVSERLVSPDSRQLMVRQRDEKGRFIAGHSGNPRGRLPKGREVKFFDLTVSSVSRQDWEAIVNKAKDQAKRGDAVARKWLADYLVGQAVSRIDNERLNANTEAGEDDRPTQLTADQIASSFTDVYRDILAHRHTEYVFYGGRGSTKSSFTSLAFVILLENNPSWHGLALRQVGNTLRDSVYSQLTWAISELGHEGLYRFTKSPLEIEYIKTGQKIYFRGADSPLKIKSIKPPFGAIGLLWFEELDAFSGENAVRSIEQSAIRGTDTAYIFKTFNPPPTKQSWANKFILTPKETRYIHESSYLSVPKEWLGQVFFDEAAHLKEVNPAAYEHEYLGVPNSTGGLIFPNLKLREITDEEINGFDYVYQGLDWGFAVDPVEWGKCAFDAKKRILYLFDEFRAVGMGNWELFEELTQRKLVKPNDLIIADSAEPKSIADLNSYGLTVRGTEKFPDSVRYSIKWLQSLNEIVVDPIRCPNTAREFSEYEYPQTKDGEFVSQYPDKNNHSIDRTRYATTMLWRKAGN